MRCTVIGRVAYPTMTYHTKHRPTDLDSIVGQPTDRIKTLISGSSTPNLLFYGPPGTGKTTTARAIAHEMHGNTRNLYEINASDERGIDTIRDRINELTRLDTGTQMTLEMNVPIVFLDEIDGMTTTAQEALRTPMEDTPAVFLLSCNDVEAVNDAVRSRCHAGGFEFDYLSTSAVRDRLETVADAEGVEIDDRRILDCAEKANGDMRTALDLLEQEVRFTTKASEQVDENDIEEVKDLIGQ